MLLKYKTFKATCKIIMQYITLKERFI